jgi:hypothetical protein
MAKKEKSLWHDSETTRDMRCHEKEVALNGNCMQEPAVMNGPKPHPPVDLHHLLQLGLEQATHAASLAARPPETARSTKLPRLLAGGAESAGLLPSSAVLVVLLPLLLGSAKPARLLLAGRGLAIRSLLPLWGCLAVGGLARRRGMPRKAPRAWSARRGLARVSAGCSSRRSLPRIALCHISARLTPVHAL